MAPEIADAPGPATRIVIGEPMRALSLIAPSLGGEAASAPGIDPTARIGAGAVLGDGVRIDPYAVIGDGAVIGADSVIKSHVVVEADVRIGTAVRIDPGAVIHRGAVLGDRVYIKARAVIGGPGFGFASDQSGHQRIPQVGGCILGDDVEIGAGSCVDRGSLDDTVIGSGTKIDNLVHVAHNVRLGRDCLVMAGVGISGSTKVGDRVILAGQSGLAGHIEVGDGSRIAGQAGVIASLPAGSAVSGYPARPHFEYLRAQAALYRLAPHVDALEALIRPDDDG